MVDYFKEAIMWVVMWIAIALIIATTITITVMSNNNLCKTMVENGYCEMPIANSSRTTWQKCK